MGFVCHILNHVSKIIEMMHTRNADTHFLECLQAGFLIGVVSVEINKFIVVAALS